MIGQDLILNKINSLSLSTMPRTIMLLGERGSGRHSICQEIAKRLNLEIIDISNELSLETIDTINAQVEPKLYIIDTKGISTREQNVILKFLEEPLKNAYIVVISSNDNLLDTVKNRCVVWRMERYTQEQLDQFYSCDWETKELIGKIATTPGQVIEYQQHDIKGMFSLAYKILENIGRATLPNTLTLLDKLAFKDEKNKYDCSLFLDVLTYAQYERVKNNKLITHNDFSMSYLLVETRNKLELSNVSKEHLFGGLLSQLRRLARNGD